MHIPLDDKPAPKVEGHAESSTTAATRRPRTRGFAFIWMLSRKDAERAIEGCNGVVVRAGTAETLVMDKQKRKKVKRLEKKAAAAAAGVKEGGEEAGEDDVDEDEDMEKEEKEKDDKRATERVIAVDWALSKDKWKEEKAKIQEDEDEEMASPPSDSEDDESEDGLGVHSGSDDNDDDAGDSQLDDEDDNGEEPVKPQLPPPETGTTLFIRNIPFNATEDELRTLYVVFSPDPMYVSHFFFGLGSAPLALCDMQESPWTERLAVRVVLGSHVSGISQMPTASYSRATSCVQRQQAKPPS